MDGYHYTLRPHEAKKLLINLEEEVPSTNTIAAVEVLIKAADAYRFGSGARGFDMHHGAGNLVARIARPKAPIEPFVWF